MYYVSTFLGFGPPPSYVSMFLELKISKNCEFLPEPSPPPFFLRVKGRSYGPSVIKDLAAAASNDWLTAGARPPSQYLAEKAFLDHKKRPATSKQI
jgi:hypothetical protein